METLLQTDVLVVGGGSAGMCAAVAAARTGAEVAIIERWPVLGGQSTMAQVNMWHTSDRTREVIFGLTAELVERLRAYDAVQVLPSFPTAHETYLFHPDLLVLVFEDMAREAGIRVLCGTPCVDVVRKGGEVVAAVVGTKRGLREIRAKLFIDATGSADLSYFGGNETEVGRPEDGKVQGMTLKAAFKGLDPDKREEIEAFGEELTAKMDALYEKGALPSHGPHWFGGDFIWRWTGTLLAATHGDPLDAEDITRAEMEARAKLPKFLKFFRETVPGAENLEIDRIAYWLGIRESRRARGLYTFTGDDVRARRSFPDAVGHGFWMVDVHDPEGSGATTWYDKSIHPEQGTTYQIPYRMTVARDLDNVFIAGRCASATHEGMAGLRVQTHCHIMGQAAGTAAALCLDSGALPAELDVSRLQQQLVDDGVLIDLDRAASA
jgi:glycine/D-amino acid oxidase-like deaminating enzyme